VEVTEDGIEAINYVARGDMRKAINALQAAALISDKVDMNTIYQITSMARPEQIRNLIKMAISGDFAGARNELDDLLLVQGLSGQDVVVQIHREMLDLDVPDTDKVRMINRIGEIDFRITEGANERIQLEALIAYMALTGLSKSTAT
jgi:replication factor C small subunit